MTFDADGGTLDGTASFTVTNNQTYASIPTATRTGYDFKGWTTNGVDWSVKTGDDRIWLTQDTAAKAKWTEKTATLTYKANGHGSEPNTVTMMYSVETKAASALSATGYTFNGWNTKSDGTGTKYVAGAQVKAANVIPSALTLYAQWTENTATLTYNANGHGTAPSAVTMKYSAETKAASAISATGYTFKGWNTAANGSGAKYEAGAQVKAADVDPKNTTLYAQWEANTYKVSFNTQGGSEVSEKTVTYDSTYGPLDTPTKAGYDFGGWWTQSTGGTQITSKTSVKITGTTTLYAHWTAKEYMLSFEPNGGEEVTPTAKKVAYNSPYGELPTPTREGYKFVGWYTDDSGGDRKYSTTTYSQTADSTLWAHWTAKTYTVYTSSSEGYFSVSSSGTFGSALSISFTGKESDGYILSEPRISIYAGTSATDSPLKVFEGSKIVDFVMGEMSDGKYYKDILITATCQKEAKTVLVEFDGNGGTPDQNTKNVTYDSPYGELPAATLEGYDLSGWFTYPSGGEEVTKATIVKATATHKLYAQWRAKSYAVATKISSGCTLTVAEQGAFGEYLSLSWKAGTKTGYTPTNTTVTISTMVNEQSVPLQTHTSGTSASYRMTGTYYPAITIAIESFFKPNTYRIYFDSQGGSIVSSKDVTYDSTYGQLSAPTRVGYDFVGWFTDKTGGNEVKSGTKVEITSAQTLYAHWTAKTYAVTTNAANCEIIVKPTGSFASPLAISWEKVDKEGYTAAFKSAKVYPIENTSNILTNFDDAASVTYLMDKVYYTNVVIEVVYTNTPNHYTVKFDLNGVSGRVEPIETQYDKSFYLRECDNKGDKLEFLGWARTAAATVPEWTITHIKTQKVKNLAASGEITLYAVWKDTRSKLSKAAHAEGVELANSGGSGFSPCSDGSGIWSWDWGVLSGGSIQGPGMLEFLWKVDGNAGSFELTIGSVIQKNFSEIGGEEVGDGWKRVSFMIPASDIAQALTWESFTEDSSLYLDYVIWTPTTTIEPTEADRRDISAIAMENGELTISFENADERFAYSLHGTNELTAARALWPILWTTNGTGTITIKPEVKMDEPQFFYYLEVHSK